jgi:hypothetical protein
MMILLLRRARALVADPAVPRWVKALLLVGIAPIPGPFDEAALVAALVIVTIAYRQAWRATRQVEAPAQ